MRKLIVLFIDGIGLAPPSATNPLSPLFAAQTKGFGLKDTEPPHFSPSSVLVPIDAGLGLPGEPQSATGQTSIFTGVNAAQLLGYHLPAFPNEELVEVILEKSIMKALADKGISVTSANMYSEKFFEDRRASEKNRFPVSTLTIEASQTDFRMKEEYSRGKAVFADITNELIRNRGYDIDLISPEEAGGRMISILEDFRFVFFEYFMTDHYGHKRKRTELDNCVDLLNRFVTTMADSLSLEHEALLIISDHGNAEDLTTGGHTRNPVPGLLVSTDEDMKKRFAECRSLTDIYDFMLDFFQ